MLEVCIAPLASAQMAEIAVIAANRDMSDGKTGDAEIAAIVAGSALVCGIGVIIFYTQTPGLSCCVAGFTATAQDGGMQCATTAHA